MRNFFRLLKRFLVESLTLLHCDVLRIYIVIYKGLDPKTGER